ncbi:MAG: glycosyltransferase family 39 protein [Anaerolineae bacterium]
MNLKPRATALLLGGALVFALLGQFYFAKRREYLWDGIFLYAVAVILFLALVRRLEGRAAPAGARGAISWAPWERIMGQPLSASLLVTSLACSLVALKLFKGKVGPASYWDVFAFWLTSIVLFLAAFLDGRWPSPVESLFHRATLRALAERVRAHRQEILLVGLCTLLAFALRFVALDAIPPNLGGDEGEMGTEALRVLQGSLTNMFATGWLAHPTLFFFLQALSLKFFGVSVFGLRLLSVIVGTLNIPFLYLLVRQMLNRRMALVAAGLLTVSHFHLHYSRLASNNIMDPLFATLTFYFLARGLQSERGSDYALSGLMLGLSQYFYVGARLIPLLVIVFMGFMAVTRKDFLRDNMGNLAALAVAALLVALPLLAYYQQRPDTFLARVNQVGIIQSGWLAREPGLTGKSMRQILTEQFLKSVLGFHYYTDPTFWYHASIPLLDFLSSILLVFGLAYAMAHLREWPYFLLTVWFWLTVFLGWFMTENPPSSMRVVIIGPCLAALVAVGLVKLVELGRVLLGPDRPLRQLALVGAVALIALANVKFYFMDYTPTRIYGNPTAEIGTELSKYLAAREGDFRVYFFGAPRMYFTYGTIRFMAHGVEGIDIRQPLTGQPTFVDPGREAVFVFLPERRGELEVVRQYYPQGRLWEFERGGQVKFVVYEVERP